MRSNQSWGVAAYLLFTFALSPIFYFLIAKSGHVGGGWAYCRAKSMTHAGLCMIPHSSLRYVTYKAIGQKEVCRGIPAFSLHSV